MAPSGTLARLLSTLPASTRSALVSVGLCGKSTACATSSQPPLVALPFVLGCLGVFSAQYDIDSEDLDRWDLMNATMSS